MPTLSNKHSNSQIRFYPTFDGGLNLSVPSESMEKNELKEAINVEFSHATGSLRVRGGLVWSGRFEQEIDAVLPVLGKEGFLARAKGTKTLYYFLWNNIWAVDGELTGDGDLSIAAWDDDYLIASGGKLQKFSSDKVVPTLETITDSPEESRLVFIRNGRVGVIDSSDIISFSWIGDCEKWDNDPDDEGTGQFVEIGYKDGMDIDAVIPLSRDLIIFKSPKGEPDKGIIWRLTGDFPDITVVEAAHNTGTFSMKSVVAVSNDVFYATTSGISTLSTVTTYGEVQTSNPDRKVSTALTPRLKASAQLWNIPVKQQLWVLPSSEEKLVWVFDYSLGIWTNFEFPATPVYAIGVNNELYLFMGRDLYYLNEDYTQDEIRDEGESNIEARLKLGTILMGQQTLIKGAFASFEVQPGCDAKLWLGNFNMPFKAGGAIDYIYDPPNDTQYASDDDDPLFPLGSVSTSRRRCIVRDWQIVPEIKISGGGCSISTLGLEIVEV